MALNESSLSDLFNSAVAAFPGTRRRQYATGTVQIENLSWSPFLGMRTLFVRCEADNREDNGGQYKPVILFKNVRYSRESGRGRVELESDGKVYYADPLDENDVLVRCQCGDFFWRFHHYNHLDKSLYGTKRKPYEAVADRGPINPSESEGMCKHLMKLMEVLRESGILLN